MRGIRQTLQAILIYVLVVFGRTWHFHENKEVAWGIIIGRGLNFYRLEIGMFNNSFTLAGANHPYGQCRCESS